MERRKRDSITIETPSNKTTQGKTSITPIKNEELYLIDEAYGKLNELTSPTNSNIQLTIDENISSNINKSDILLLDKL